MIGPIDQIAALEYLLNFPHSVSKLHLPFHGCVNWCLPSLHLLLKTDGSKFRSTELLTLPAFAAFTSSIKIFAFSLEVSYQPLTFSLWRYFTSSKNSSCRRIVIIPTFPSSTIQTLLFFFSFKNVAASPIVEVETCADGNTTAGISDEHNNFWASSPVSATFALNDSDFVQRLYCKSSNRRFTPTCFADLPPIATMKSQSSTSSTISGSKRKLFGRYGFGYW